MAEVSTRKRGTKWQYYFEGASIDGKRQRIYKSGFATKKEALEAGVKALAEYNNTGKIVFDSDISMSDFLDLWLNERCSFAVNSLTYNMYSNYINYSLKPLIGKYKLSSISYNTIQSLVKERYEHGWKISTIHKCVNIITSAINWAVKNSYLKTNPIKDIEYPVDETLNVKEKAYTDDQMKIFFETYKDHQLMYTILMIGYHCGLRISETLGLTWDNIDFEKKTMSINKQLQYTKDKGKRFCKPKFSSIRTIDLDDVILDYLSELKTRQELHRDYYLYHYHVKNDKIIESNTPVKNSINFVAIKEDGKEMDRRAVTVYLGRCKKKGMPVFETHDLRHTHCTKLIQNGINLKYVQKRLGHKNIEITLEIYNHLNQDGHLSEVSKLNNLF